MAIANLKNTFSFALYNNNAALKIYSEKDRTNFTNSIITTGFFDGIHKGHQAIFSRLKMLGNQKVGEKVVVTYWPHPRKVLYPDNKLKLINTLEEKKDLIRDAGIDHLIILPFSKAFASQPAETFIVSTLVKKYNVKHLLIGYNHRFGKDKQGDVNELKKLGNQYDFTTEQVDPYTFDDIPVSSTQIREYIFHGDMVMANKFLGYHYFLQGKVVRGKAIGQQIDFPTANICPDSDNKLLPKEGVYAVEVFHQTKKYFGMLNIGSSPTVCDKKDNISVEVHILGFNKNIYDETLKVAFIKRIRDEIKFDSVEQLKEQLRKDKKYIKKFNPGTGENINNRDNF